MQKTAKFINEQLKKQAQFQVGDNVKVYQKIKEGSKERIQVFEGLVIAKKHGKGINATFTVRKVTSGVGVEKIYPLHSPFIDKIEIVKTSKARRSKLYFIRKASGKRGKLKEAKRELYKEAVAVEDTKAEDVIEDPVVEQEIKEEVKA